MTYDLKIVGGTIVDGSGSAGYRGDVGILDGRIVALGDAQDTAERIIDAEGAVVSPGLSISIPIMTLRLSGTV